MWKIILVLNSVLLFVALSASEYSTPALTKCKEYAKLAESQSGVNCGKEVQFRIAGGTNARPKEFPHMAQLGYGDEPNIAWSCGGSLISEQFILSAAHCVQSSSKGPAKWARLGDLDTSKDTDDASPITVRIVERIKHPEYKSQTVYNDIALYKLEKPIELNSYIRPICLDLGGRTYEKAVATGWGATSWSGSTSDMLQKVTLNLVEQKKCNESYADGIGRRLPHGIDYDYMICAGDETGKDACQGDAGGPLQVELEEPKCMYSVIGITSFGKSCAVIAGVYTRVSRYVPWIESVVWPQNQGK